MSVTEILRLTGHKTGNKDTALLNMDGLQVQVKLLDVKQVFGRVDVLVTPVSGNGHRWVQVDKLIEVTH